MEQALMSRIAIDAAQPPAAEPNQADGRPPADLAALISNLSHGIRTPLNPVVGFIELLLETELDSTQREYLEQAHVGVLDIGRHLTSLTTQMRGPDRAADGLGNTTRSSQKTGGQLGQRNKQWSQHVLIVDDDPVNRQVAEHMVKRLGHQADLACDGHEAVEAVTQREYDLVLMDLQMPGMGGLDAIDAIRTALPWYRQPAIFAVTAGPAAGDERRVESTGMDGFVTKPMRLRDLTEVFDRVAQSPRASRAWALGLQSPGTEVIDKGALGDWIGLPEMTESLVELIVPALFSDLGDLIDRLNPTQRKIGPDLLEPTNALLERAESIFARPLTYFLEHLAEEVGRSDWMAAATLFEPLRREYLALGDWLMETHV